MGKSLIDHATTVDMRTSSGIRTKKKRSGVNCEADFEAAIEESAKQHDA